MLLIFESDTAYDLYRQAFGYVEEKDGLQGLIENCLHRMKPVDRQKVLGAFLIEEALKLHRDMDSVRVYRDANKELQVEWTKSATN